MLITTPSAARYLGITTMTLRRRWAAGKISPHEWTPGRHPRWSVGVLRDILADELYRRRQELQEARERFYAVLRHPAYAWVPLGEAATLLGVCKNTIVYHIDHDRITARRSGYGRKNAECSVRSLRDYQVGVIERLEARIAFTQSQLDRDVVGVTPDNRFNRPSVAPKTKSLALSGGETPTSTHSARGATYPTDPQDTHGGSV